MKLLVNKLEAALKKSVLSESEIARRSMMDRQKLNRLKRNNRVNLDDLSRIAKVLDIKDVRELIDFK